MGDVTCPEPSSGLSAAVRSTAAVSVVVVVDSIAAGAAVQEM
jgi:hypothetical protein